MRAAGSVTATEFIDENNGSYYVNPSSSSLAIRTAGSIQGTRFLDENDPAYFINPSSPTTSINVQGDARIGTSNNGAGLLVYAFTGFGIGLRNVDEGSDWLLYTQSDEDFGLGFDGAYRGQFDNVTGVYSWTSDRRLKDDIRSFDTVLPKVLQLSPRQYLYKSDIDKKQRMGFIAQEVEEIFPELVNPPSDLSDELSAYYTLDYSGFGVLAIQAIKEQQAIIDKQSEEINQLKEELKLVQSLEARIKKLEVEE